MSDIANAITTVTSAAADLSEWRRDDPKAASRLRWIADRLCMAGGQLLEEADELDIDGADEEPAR
jgi:hypothetical protein